MKMKKRAKPSPEIAASATPLGRDPSSVREISQMPVTARIKPAIGKGSRGSFRQYAERGRDRRPEDGRDRCGDSHVSLSQRAIEQRQPNSARGACRHGPAQVRERRKNFMVRQSQACDHDGAGQMSKTCQEERIEAPGGMAADKVADAPAADGAESVEGGSEVWGDGHRVISSVAERPHFSQKTREMGPRPARW
jgi:hypothetical protein